LRERYARVLRARHVLPLVLSSILARMPIGIVGLALVLFVEERTDSFGAAGAVSAAFALAAGVGSPLQGRLIDRVGQTRVMLPAVVVHATALVVLIAAGLAGAAVGALIALAAVAGAAIPPVSAALRPLWPGLLKDDPELISAAYALDAILIEAVFVGGPLLTGVVVAVFSPAAALGVGVALAVVGTLSFTAQPPSRAWRPESHTVGWAGPLHAPGMRTLLLCAIPAGVMFGGMEVALAGFGEDHGQASLAGPLIAAWSLGSAVGGVIYGAVAHRLTPLALAWLRLNSALPLAMAVVLIADSPLVMFLLIPFAGLLIAPVQASQNQLVGAVAPAGTITEAFTWVLMGLVVGVAAGNALAGVLVDESGWRTAVAVLCVIGLAGAALAWGRRATLRTAAAYPPGATSPVS
jgi:MFS family permease